MTAPRRSALVLVLLLPFLVDAVLPKSGCRGAMPLAHLVEISYEGQVELLRKGMPPEVISDYFDRAFEELNKPTCFCPGQDILITEPCRRKVFFGVSKLYIRALQDTINSDARNPQNSQLFPFYHINAEQLLPSLPDDIISEIDEDKEWTYDKIYSSLDEATEPESQFIASEEVLVDTEAYAVCKDYALNGATIPATSFMAYVLGAAAQVTYARGNTAHVVENFLKEAIGLTFKAARCQRKSGNRLLIPIISLSQFSKDAQVLMDVARSSPHLTQEEEKYFSLLPELSNLLDVMRVPLREFQYAIFQLCSLQTRGRTLYANEGWTQLLPVVQLFDRITLQKYAEAYSTTRSASGSGCADGYAFVTRLTPVLYPEENCCPVTCITSSSDSLTAAFEQESCCDDQ